MERHELDPRAGEDPGRGLTYAALIGLGLLLLACAIAQLV